LIPVLGNLNVDLVEPEVNMMFNPESFQNNTFALDNLYDQHLPEIQELVNKVVERVESRTLTFA
jgi:hypothetical protein